MRLIQVTKAPPYSSLQHLVSTVGYVKRTRGQFIYCIIPYVSVWPGNTVQLLETELKTINWFTFVIGYLKQLFKYRKNKK